MFGISDQQRKMPMGDHPYNQALRLGWGHEQVVVIAMIASPGTLFSSGVASANLMHQRYKESFEMRFDQ